MPLIYFKDIISLVRHVKIRQEAAFQEGHKHLSEYQDLKKKFWNLPGEKRGGKEEKGGEGRAEGGGGRGGGEEEEEDQSSHQTPGRHEPHHSLENPTLMVTRPANDLSQV